MSANTSLAINHLDLHLHLGLSQSERLDKQTVRVDIEIVFVARPKACVSDEIQDTHCYDELIQLIFEKTKDKNYCLIEYLCQEIHGIVIAFFKNQHKVTVQITKHPVIQGFSGNVRFSYGN